ncbi:MAG TPA: ABC transporter substrate-binding protein [Novosphingobium sp.]|nr:ABC transporter substrate-binding protein [Novosphingobium sp.]
MRGVVAIAALILAGCGPLADVRQPSPSRILSLNPCTDAILAQVADPAQIAGLSTYSSDPAQSSMDVALARRFPANGGTIEEVLAVRPTMVIDGGFSSPAVQAAYRRAGIAYAGFGIARSIAENEAQIRQLARLAGHPDRGEALIGRIEAALQAGAPLAGAPRITALVWQGGGRVAGRETLIGEMIERTGFAHFSALRGLGQSQLLPVEQVMADPPQVILAVTHGQAEDRILNHPALRSVAGLRRYRLDPALEYCGGPTLIALAGRLAHIRAELAGGGI